MIAPQPGPRRGSSPGTGCRWTASRTAGTPARIVAGALISTVTAPVGVSGAVFLLQVRLSVLAVPSPAVTASNLLFNAVAGPGASDMHWFAMVRRG